MSRKFVYYGAGRSADEFINPYIDWSLRNNTQNYNGAYIRVRRVDDNQEKDINGVNNELDLSDVISFANGSDLRVVIIYNKGVGGSQFDLIMPVAGFQPYIFKSNDFIMVNGKPSIDFLGGDLTIRTEPYAQSLLDKDVIVSNVFESQQDVSIQGVFEEYLQSNAENRIAIYSDTRSFNFRFCNFRPTAPDNTLSFSVQQPISTQRQFTYMYNNENISGFAEGVSVDSVNDNSIFTVGDKIMRLGRQSSPSFIFEGKWQETIIDLDLSKKSLIETNINDYYGIY